MYYVCRHEHETWKSYKDPAVFKITIFIRTFGWQKLAKSCMVFERDNQANNRVI